LAQNRQQLEIDLRLNVDSLNQGIKQAKGDFQSYITSIKTALANLPDGRSALGKEFKAAKQEAQELLKTLRELSKSKNVTQQQSLGAASQVQTFGKNLANTTDRALLEQNKADIRQMTLAQKQAYATTIQDDSRYRKELSYTQKLIREEYKKTEQAIKQQEAVKKAEIAQQNKLLRQTEEMVNRSITLRYALYDVASSLQSASTGMINYGKAVFNAAIAQETAFSRIEKTQVGAPQFDLDSLKRELVDLSTQIPRTFDELTSIGMLGAQLGIATKDIANFTEVVAKFSTITGVTVEETALAFGRLASLLNVPAGQFENLGASIAQVGVNGASTEQQILSTAKQIGAVGNAAGFSAGEVVGLASAMASLGIAPEEARGVLIPTFQEISRAVRSFNSTTKEGNERLKTFSEVAGVSAEEFVTLWSDKTGGGAYDVFERFIQGLGNTDIAKSLDRLGLDGNRTSKGLTAMGNSAEKMGDQVREAVEGFGEATFLDASFATTLEDISSKLKMTQSAVEALLASFAGDKAVLGIFGIILDLVTMLANALRDVAGSSRVGSFIIGLGSAAVIAIGFILQLVSAIAIGVGGFLALKVAAASALNNPAVNNGFVTWLAGLVGVRNAAATAVPAVAALGPAGTVAGNGLRLTGIGAYFAAGGIRSLLASTGVGLLLVGLGIALEKTINLLFPIEDAAKNGADGLDEFGDAADGAAKDTSTLRSELDEILSRFNEVALAPYKTQQALNDLGESMAKNGKEFDAFSQGGRTNMEALNGVIEAIKDEANGSAQETYQALSGFMIALQSQGLVTTEVYEHLTDVMAQFAGAAPLGPFIPTEFDLTSFLDGLEGGLDDAGGAVDTLADKIDRLFAKLDQRVSLMSSLDKLKESLIDNGASFSVFSESGRNNIGALRSTIDQLAEASGNNKKKFSSDLNALKIAMVQAGVDGGRALAIINKAIKSTGVNAKASRDSVRDFAAALNTLDEQRVVGVANAIERLSGSVMEYLNARWMLANTQLEIAAGWEDIANSTRGARDEIEDISAELASFAAQRGTLEYQLDIALKYGDTLRANELRAQIAELNQSEAEAIANNQQQQEQEDPIAQLLEQQRALQAMLQSYVEIGSAEVISARNKREAKEAINGIVVEFENQARAAGVSEANVIKYSAELRAALKLARELAKPAKYKIDADTKAALDQIKDFASSAKAQINSIPRTVTVSVNYVTTGTPAGTRSGPAVVTTDKPKTKKAMGGLITASNGGFITGPGTGTSDSIPALLSDGEFVIRAAAVASYGLDFMNSLNNMNVRPAVTGFGQVAQASSETMVYLSPEDRLLLRQAIDRPINLYTENARIAQSANSGNVLLAQRGQN
jgi:TP901 family phage tail tape measure protein